MVVYVRKCGCGCSRSVSLELDLKSVRGRSAGREGERGSTGCRGWDGRAIGSC